MSRLHVRWKCPASNAQWVRALLAFGGARGRHVAMLEFPSSLPPQPTRPNARMPSAERDLLPRHLGSRKMRRFINDNFIDSEIEMNGDGDEPYQLRELKGTTFSNPAVLMMISEEEFDVEAKPRIRQVCLAPLDRMGRARGYKATQPGCPLDRPKIARGRLVGKQGLFA